MGETQKVHRITESKESLSVYLMMEVLALTLCVIGEALYHEVLELMYVPSRPGSLGYSPKLLFATSFRGWL